MLIKFNYGCWKFEYYNNNLQDHRIGFASAQDIQNNKWWSKNGFRHREDGPAVEYINSYNFYHLNGKRYEEKQYWAIIKFKGFI